MIGLFGTTEKQLFTGKSQRSLDLSKKRVNNFNEMV